jgi:hypothetical protein
MLVAAVTTNTAAVTCGNPPAPVRRARACLIAVTLRPGLTGPDGGKMSRVRKNRICGI